MIISMITLLLCDVIQEEVKYAGKDYLCVKIRQGPEGYKTFFMLNSIEHKIYQAHKC